MHSTAGAVPDSPSPSRSEEGPIVMWVWRISGANKANSEDIRPGPLFRLSRPGLHRHGRNTAATCLAARTRALSSWPEISRNLVGECVPERHFGQAVGDPARVARILQATHALVVCRAVGHVASALARERGCGMPMLLPRPTAAWACPCPAASRKQVAETCHITAKNALNASALTGPPGRLGAFLTPPTP